MPTHRDPSRPHAFVARSAPAGLPTRHPLSAALGLCLSLGLGGCPPAPAAEASSAHPSDGGEDATQASVDVGATSDQGLRPAVVEYIDMTYPDSEVARTAARQLARALEQQTGVDSSLEAQQVAHSIAAAIACLDDAGLSDSDLRVELEARTFDTEERIEAEHRFARMLSGRVVMLPSTPQCDHAPSEEGR